MTQSKVPENFRKKLDAQYALDTYYKQLQHQAAMTFTNTLLKTEIAEEAAELGIRAANVFINKLRLEENRNEEG